MRFRLASWTLGLLVALSGANAAAQQLDGFALSRFEPAPAGDRFFGVQGGDPGGHGAVYAMLLGNYGYRPLALYSGDARERVGDVVSDQLLLHGGLSLALWGRLLLSAELPVAVVTDGESPASGGLRVESPEGAALGDVRLGARVRVFGAPRGPFQLGVAGSVWLPSGAEEKFAGDGRVRGLPALVLSGEAGPFVYAVNGGILVRAQKTVLSEDLDDELHVGAAAGLQFANRALQVGPELYGSTQLRDPWVETTTSIEALLGLRARVGAFVLGAAAGPGLTEGIGSSTLRALASLAFVPESKPRPVPPPDRDRDGIFNAQDACPDTWGVSHADPRQHGCPPDHDADGILDRDDACVDVPGQPHQDPKQHGCPPDRDRDGVADDVDACPDTLGQLHDDPKRNGCPPDRDDDGVIDAEDACPDVAGVASAESGKNGCPPDSDGDGITDDRDACPRESGKPDPDPTKNGCPTLVRVTESQIEILQQVQFKTNSDQILPESDELLREVAGVLREHPEIVRLEVEGHTDDRGSDRHNKALSQRRAESVVKWLTGQGGIDGSRLSARGYGEEQPLADNTSEEGRQRNRRVQFRIVSKAETQPQAPAAPPAGSAPAQPGSAPAQPGSAPAQPGSAPAQPGSAPAQPGSAPAQPGSASDPARSP